MSFFFCIVSKEQVISPLNGVNAEILFLLETLNKAKSYSVLGCKSRNKINNTGLSFSANLFHLFYHMRGRIRNPLTLPTVGTTKCSQEDPDMARTHNESSMDNIGAKEKDG